MHLLHNFLIYITAILQNKKMLLRMQIFSMKVKLKTVRKKFFKILKKFKYFFSFLEIYSYNKGCQTLICLYEKLLLTCYIILILIIY